MNAYQLILGLGIELAAHHSAAYVRSRAERCRMVWLATDETQAAVPPSSEYASRIVLPSPAAADGESMSRRAWRTHFLQSQDLLWQSTDAACPPDAQDDVHIVLLVNSGDKAASAYCLDSLHRLRSTYPKARLDAVFLMPNAADADERLACAAALMLEWHMPTVDGTQPATLWDAAYVQTAPQSTAVPLDWAALLHQVTALARADAVGGGLQDALAARRPAAGKKPGVPLPPFVFTADVSMCLDERRLQELLQHTMQAQLLQVLLKDRAAAAVSVQDWVLDAADLLLNRTDVEQRGMGGERHDSIEHEWQTRGEFFMRQKRPVNQAWDEWALRLQADLQKVCDKHFRGMGADLFYSLSQTRMERLLEHHIGHIKRAMWQSWQQGQCSITTLINRFEAVFDHYRDLQEAFEIEQRRLQSAIAEREAAWQAVISAWQGGSKRERAQIEQQYSEAATVAWLTEWFAWQCQSKAVAFALYFVQQLLPQYQRILADVNAIAAVWKQAMLAEQQLVQEGLMVSKRQWLQAVTRENSQLYLLQPDAAALQVLMQAWQGERAVWTADIVAAWVRRLGDDADFGVLRLWLQQSNWQVLPERIAEESSRRLLHSSAAADGLQNALARRMGTLSEAQCRQLEQWATEAALKRYQRQCRPLGKVLSADSTYAECAVWLLPPQVSADIEAVRVLRGSLEQYGDSVMLNHDQTGLSIVAAATCTWPEWQVFDASMAAYRRLVGDDAARLAWQIVGTAEEWRQAQVLLGTRNRELVRGELLMAAARGELTRAAAGYVWQSRADAQTVNFAAENWDELVDSVPLSAIRQMLLRSRSLHGQGLAADAAARLAQHLDALLAEMRRQIVPEGKDLADLDWKDAGRYQVWLRTVQQLKRRYLATA